MIELEALGHVSVLHLRDGENRFNRYSIDAINSALDEVTAIDGPVALVTVGDGKYFSNGLDLDWMQGDGASDTGFLEDVHRLLERVLRLDVITVAAINGHAFAGGAMLAAAHDFRIMRSDRGYWCLPEVDLGLPLTPVMYATVEAHIPRPALTDAVLTGRRFSGEEALEAGIVHEIHSADELLARAVTIADAHVAKDRTVLHAHKILLHGPPTT